MHVCVSVCVCVHGCECVCVSLTHRRPANPPSPPRQGCPRSHTCAPGTAEADGRLLSEEAARVSKQPLPHSRTAGHHLGTHLPVTSDLQSPVCNRPTGASSWGFFRSRSIFQRVSNPSGEKKNVKRRERILSLLQGQHSRQWNVAPGHPGPRP